MAVVAPRATARMISLQAVARQLDIPVPTNSAELPADMPRPDGRLGGTPWWWSTTIDDWLDTSGGSTARPRPGRI